MKHAPQERSAKVGEGAASEGGVFRDYLRHINQGLNLGSTVVSLGIIIMFLSLFNLWKS